MTRLLHGAVVALLFAAVVAPARAQDDETAFNRSQADKLNQFAKNASKKGFPRQARLLWMQVVKLYDPDHAEARKGLGHVKVGSSWAPDPKLQPSLADTGSGSDGAALFRAYETLKKDLAGAHKRQAQTWAKAGRADKANQHWQMVLRWSKDDVDAQKALDHHEVGGVTGTDLEQTLYERSKAIEKVVAEQTAKTYPVEAVEVKEPVLDRAQVKYVSFKSENFLLHGDPGEEDHLKEALVWAERTLPVLAVALPWQAQVRGKSAYFVGKDTYKQILNAHADRLPDLKWMLEHSSAANLDGLRVGATGSTQTLYDAMVRDVTRDWAGFVTDGLREGIGHTFVGMMFNNNRLFVVAKVKEDEEATVTSEEDHEYTSPDFDVWKNLALEMAWKQTGGVPAIDLPYCEAATFTNEQRIKAWSFCDYVTRRDPELLRKLDRLGAEAQQQRRKQPVELAKKFEEQAGVSIAQLDKEWEDFWTEATPVLAAIRNNTPPLQAISKNVEKWLQAFNAARAQNHATPVTWSSQLSTRCYEHALYLKANKNERGPAAEHRELPELGGSHLGSMFAQMALVETGANLGQAKKMFESWLRVPGYRDALVHDFLLSVGIYQDGDIFVLNATAGLGAPRSKKSGYLCHPWKGASGVPTEVSVADIGPELVELLEKNGRKPQKVVGYPLTMHFGSNVQGDRHSYRCSVVDPRGNKVEGAILLDSGKIRRSTAPGMVTFYPFEPLPHGKINVRWTWEVDGRPNELSADFTTK
ncbi:MAG: CAP domain-containing protein [Planctomycetota bacterium]